ncbi:MAG: AAA family ATPase, partial [Solirubrobacteraceae bacterium]
MRWIGTTLPSATVGHWALCAGCGGFVCATTGRIASDRARRSGAGCDQSPNAGHMVVFSARRTRESAPEMQSRVRRGVGTVSPSWSPFLRRSWSTMAGGGLLIGRERELLEVERRLASARLVTVTGAGGCGKTRLSVEVAERAVSSAQHTPAVVIEVASAANAEQLVDAALRAVGARERVGRRPSQVLLEYLAERRLLLVFDNCEHLAAAVGHVVRELLDGARGLRVLVASREPLGTSG